MVLCKRDTKPTKRTSSGFLKKKKRILDYNCKYKIHNYEAILIEING